MCNTLKLRLHWRVSKETMQHPGLTFDSATDTLSQHRANFSIGEDCSAEMLSPIYKVDDENSDTIR
jgi:hypothetical protein